MTVIGLHYIFVAKIRKNNHILFGEARKIDKKSHFYCIFPIFMPIFDSNIFFCSINNIIKRTAQYFREIWLFIWCFDIFVLPLHPKKSVLWELSKVRKNKELSSFLNRYLLKIRTR